MLKRSSAEHYNVHSLVVWETALLSLARQMNNIDSRLNILRATIFILKLVC